MRRLAALVLLLFWLAGTAYLAVATFWIVASTQWNNPPVIYLGGLIVVLSLWVWCSAAVFRLLRRL